MEEVINYKTDARILMKKYPDGHLPDLIITISDCRGLFQCCSEIKTINSITFTKKITDCYCMFAYCYKLEMVPLFDTSQVENMCSMFSNCHNLKSVPLFDVANVYGMSWLFFNCFSLEEIPEFDIVNSYTFMSRIIDGCIKLKKIPNFILLNELAK